MKNAGNNFKCKQLCKLVVIGEFEWTREHFNEHEPPLCKIMYKISSISKFRTKILDRASGKIESPRLWCRPADCDEPPLNWFKWHWKSDQYPTSDIPKKGSQTLLGVSVKDLSWIIEIKSYLKVLFRPQVNGPSASVHKDGSNCWIFKFCQWGHRYMQSPI